MNAVFPVIFPQNFKDFALLFPMRFLVLLKAFRILFLSFLLWNITLVCSYFFFPFILTLNSQKFVSIISLRSFFLPFFFPNLLSRLPISCIWELLHLSSVSMFFLCCILRKCLGSVF